VVRGPKTEPRTTPHGLRNTDHGWQILQLSTIVFLPLIGALLVLVAGGRGDRTSARARAVRVAVLAVSIVEFWRRSICGCGSIREC
jgi:hypothetical protein